MKSALCMFVVCTLSLSAHAGQDDEILSPHHIEHQQSSRDGVVELRFGPYLPRVDSDPALNGATPFRDFFGTTGRVLVGVEVDWQVYRLKKWGSIGPGVSASYTQFSGQAKFQRGGKDSQDATGLSVYPFAGLAVLRLDALHEQLSIPLQLYAKGGLSTAYWRATGTDGVYDVNGKTSSGMTWGTRWALGAGFQLDVLDPLTAARFDESSGINHTYLFWEYGVSTLNGLSNDPVMRLGSKDWNAGLAFEF